MNWWFWWRLMTINKFTTLVAFMQKTVTFWFYSSFGNRLFWSIFAEYSTIKLQSVSRPRVTGKPPGWEQSSGTTFKLSDQSHKFKGRGRSLLAGSCSVEGKVRESINQSGSRPSVRRGVTSGGVKGESSVEPQTLWLCALLTSLATVFLLWPHVSGRLVRVLASRFDLPFPLCDELTCLCRSIIMKSYWSMLLSM